MNTDYTRTADSLKPGDLVNDDESYDRIRVETVKVTPSGVSFTGTRERLGVAVHRSWPATARVTITEGES